MPYQFSSNRFHALREIDIVITIFVFLILGIYGCGEPASEPNAVSMTTVQRIEEMLEVNTKMMEHMTKVDDRLKIVEESVFDMDKKMEDAKSKKLAYKLTNIENQMKNMNKRINLFLTVYGSKSGSDGIIKDISVNTPIRMFDGLFMLSVLKSSRKEATFKVFSRTHSDQKPFILKQNKGKILSINGGSYHFELIKSSDWGATISVIPQQNISQINPYLFQSND